MMNRTLYISVDTTLLPRKMRSEPSQGCDETASTVSEGLYVARANMYASQGAKKCENFSLLTCAETGSKFEGFISSENQYVRAVSVEFQTRTNPGWIREWLSELTLVLWRCGHSLK